MCAAQKYQVHFVSFVHHCKIFTSLLFKKNARFLFLPTDRVPLQSFVRPSFFFFLIGSSPPNAAVNKDTRKNTRLIPSAASPVIFSNSLGFPAAAPSLQLQSPHRSLTRGARRHSGRFAHLSPLEHSRRRISATVKATAATCGCNEVEEDLQC